VQRQKQASLPLLQTTANIVLVLPSGTCVLLTAYNSNGIWSILMQVSNCMRHFTQLVFFLKSNNAHRTQDIEPLVL